MKILFYLLVAACVIECRAKVNSQVSSQEVTATFTRLEIYYVPTSVDMNRAQTGEDIIRDPFYMIAIYAPYRDDLINRVQYAIADGGPLADPGSCDARWALVFSNETATVSFAVSRYLDSVYSNGRAVECTPDLREILLGLTQGMK